MRKNFSQLLNKSHSATTISRYYTPYPVRPYERFPKQRTSGGGIDENGLYQEFMKRDVCKPLQHTFDLYKEPVRPKQTGWALKTTKQCQNPLLLPKFQQFKQYNFPKRTEEQTKKYLSNFLDTDNISVRIPKIDAEKVNKESFLKIKEKFGPMKESEKSWAPFPGKKTMVNKSSVEYNILNNNKIQNDFKVGIFNFNLVNHRQKGIGEFSDLTRVNRNGFCKEYEEAFKENPKIFRNYNGIFSHLYDMAHKNGNIYLPFREEKRSDGQSIRLQKSKSAKIIYF